MFTPVLSWNLKIAASSSLLLMRPAKYKIVKKTSVGSFFYKDQELKN